MLLPILILAHSAQEQKVIILDAGSTGTRIYLYSYSDPDDPYSFKLLNDSQGHSIIKKSKGKLASCIENNNCSAIADELFTFVNQYVPETDRPSIPVLVYATAGMRLINKTIQDAVFDEFFKSVSRNYTYNCKRSDFRTIEGHEEAYFSWIGVNFLLGSFRTRKTTQTFEIGGASAQVALETSDSNYKEYIHEVGIGKDIYKVFATSWLGLGFDQVMKTHREALINDNETTDPCILEGTTIEFEGVNLTGSGNYSRCREDLMNEVYTKNCTTESCLFWDVPRPNTPTLVFGMSVPHFQMALMGHDDNVTMGTLVKEFKNFSTLTLEQALEKYGSGNQVEIAMPEQVVTHIFAMDGIGLSDDGILRAPDKIDGAEPQWTLGAVLAKYSSAVNVPPKPPFPIWLYILIGVVALLLIAVIVVIICKFCRKKEEDSKMESLIMTLDNDMAF